MNSDGDAKLRDLLEHARRATTYYAGKLPPLEESIAGNASEILAGLPVLTRQHVQSERVRLRSVDGDPRSWRVVRTTGTTGEPVEVVLDEAARMAEAAALASHADRCLGNRDWAEHDLVHVVLHPGATSRAMASPWSPRARVVKWNLSQAWQAEDAQFLASLAHLHGRIVTCMPSIAELLARRLLAANAAGAVKPLLLLLSGETAEPSARREAAEAFRCPVSTLYTLAEAGIVGAECLTHGGYHVEDAAVFVEILDDRDHAVAPGAEGWVTITPLANRAMPLLRYRTGDRGRMAAGPCPCGRDSPRIELALARRPSRLLTSSGAAVNTVRFAKLLAALETRRIAVTQGADRVVLVSYEADHALDQASRSILDAALRSALGPEIEVNIVGPGDTPSAPVEPVSTQAAPGPLTECEGSRLGELAAWLRRTLDAEQDVESAILTGSALDPSTTTKFSDIDLVLLVRGNAAHPHWLDLARRLRRGLPRLTVNVDVAAGLEQRAPLLACRLLRERAEVLGRADLARVPWPKEADLRAAARPWLQNTAAILWQRLTAPLPRSVDPLHEAWMAGKFGLDALRYRYLARGERETAARLIIERARRDPHIDTEWFANLLEVLEIAREHRPPPLATEATVHAWLLAALSCVRSTAAAL